MAKKLTEAELRRIVNRRAWTVPFRDAVRESGAKDDYEFIISSASPETIARLQLRSENVRRQVEAMRPLPKLLAPPTGPIPIAALSKEHLKWLRRLRYRWRELYRMELVDFE